jgi:four helix bundle protein
MLAKDFSLYDQIYRAAVSAMTNIAEGLIVSRRPNLHIFWVLRVDLL